MKKLNVFNLTIVFFFLLFSVACNKDETPEPEPQPNAAEFEVKTASVPDAMMQSNEEGAVQVRSFIGIMNGMTVYGEMMKPPKKSSQVFLKDGEPQTYTWTVDDGTGTNNYNVTLKIYETTISIKWEMIIDGMIEGMQLNNYTFIKAEETKDGSNHTITIYDIDNVGDVFMILSWSEMGGTSFFEFEVPQDVLINAEIYADGSGSIEVKEWGNGQYLLDFKAVWDASGHGEYWEYDEGELYYHDTF